jgi:protein translocase SecG subunit
MVLLILMQKGKGGIGLGSMGGSNQLLFGGSGGQDLFQKLTWILGTLLIFGSLGLAIWETKQVGASSALLHHSSQRPQAPIPTQSVDDV